MDTQVFAATDEYINSLFAQEDDVLANITSSLRQINSPMAEGSISAGQGRFLQLLAYMCRARTVLELGTLGGYSTIWMARALPAGGKLVTLELNDEHAKVAQTNIELAGLEDKVEIRVGDCRKVLEDMISKGEGPFDLVFMDADKPPYTEYFQMALRLARHGTIIVADNVIRDGAVLNPESEDAAVKGVQRFNKMLAGEQRVDASIIQTIGIKAHDGMAIAIVK